VTQYKYTFIPLLKMELINMVATLLFLSLSLFLFIGLLPVVTFAQSDHLGVPTIAQIPSVEEQSQRGFLILTTNVINDNGGSKQAPDFIINVLGSPSFPSILQAAQTPDVQIISIQAGYYSISVNNTQGYDTSFGNQCEGQIKAGEIKSCFITLDESSTTIDKVTTIPQLPIMPLSLPSLLLPPLQTSGEEGEQLTISQIPLTEEEQSELGFLVVGTNVINDNGGSKQASDFIINVLGSPAFPSSFKAAFSNLMQIISIQPGQFSISVNNTQGYDTSFGNQCEGQIKAGEIKTCLITVNDKGTTTPPPPPPTGDVDAKFAELIKRANPNELVILDGSGSTGTITSWSIVQTDGQPSVVLENAPTKPFSKQFIMPNTEDTLKFTLTVRNDQTGKQNTDTMTVSKTLTTPPPPPPPSGNFPVSNVTWFYDSKNALSKDMTLNSGTTHPQDRVLLSSGASGVSSHPIKNGFIEVQSGGGNGRVYWNYHEVPQFSQLPTAGFNTAMTGTFMFKPGIDNLSIKDGNHNTDGWVLNGKYAFGGFGLAFHRDNVESKAEYWHNNQGNGITVPYPNGLKMIDNKEYKFFLTLVTDRAKQEVVLNAWLDFGDGKGWIQVMKDRKWGQSGWSPGSVPNGEDKADILKGPAFIKKHHIWTRANGGSSMPIKDIMIGTLPFLS
jgi:Prealbumin-like fold domain